MVNQEGQVGVLGSGAVELDAESQVAREDRETVRVPKGAHSEAQLLADWRLEIFLRDAR